MLQSLRGSKLPLRLLKSIYRRLLALLLHCVKHPIKTFFFIVKAYLLLMLFALCLAFSVGSFAQTAPLNCEPGETPLDSVGGCGILSSEMSCQIDSMNGKSYTGSVIYRGNKIAEYTEALSAYDRDDPVPPSCGPGQYVKQTYTHDAEFSCSEAAFGASSFTKAYVITSTTVTTSNSCNNTSEPSTTVNTRNYSMFYQLSWSDEVQCPDSHPIGPVQYELNNYCYRLPEPEPEPCDCSDLTGSNPHGINYFYAANGTYSQANPPNCISRDDNEDGDIPSCNCKLIATKWSSADVNINGTIYQRWQPVPDQNGVTGVFTGGQCDESEKDTPPDTPEKCYQLGNGQNFCLEDPDQKCAKIDGIMTCQAGCGTVNGEFFCFENDDPEEPLPDPDDDITDPDTPLNDMVKRDFKDVLGGTESRLDILARLMSDIKTNTSKGDSDLAAKQDATNRLLKEISDKLDEEGDDETPTNPQPTYNTDKLEEFVNPNDWGEKNFRTVAVAFKDRIMQTPIMQTVQNFFNVALSGTCPTWHTTVNMPFGGTFDININQLCSEAMTNIWPSIRAIIVLIFTFVAFKVAFTNE